MTAHKHFSLKEQVFIGLRLLREIETVQEAMKRLKISDATAYKYKRMARDGTLTNGDPIPAFGAIVAEFNERESAGEPQTSAAPLSDHAQQTMENQTIDAAGALSVLSGVMELVRSQFRTGQLPDLVYLAASSAYIRLGGR